MSILSNGTINANYFYYYRFTRYHLAVILFASEREREREIDYRALKECTVIAIKLENFLVPRLRVFIESDKLSRLMTPKRSEIWQLTLVAVFALPSFNAFLLTSWRAAKMPDNITVPGSAEGFTLIAEIVLFADDTIVKVQLRSVVLVRFHRPR